MRIKRSGQLRGYDRRERLRAELPDDFGWAKSNPIVSRAFACFAEAAEAAGKAC